MTEPLRSAQRSQPRVLEVGPGTGIVTAQIVPCLGSKGHLDIVELQHDFVRLLQDRFVNEQRFRAVREQVAIHHAAVQDFASSRSRCSDRGGGLTETDANALAEMRDEYDFIISGLPLNNFTPEMVEQLMGLFCGLLKPGGVLSYFEYMYLRGLRGTMGLPATRRRFAQLDSVVSKWLTHEFRRDNAWLNVPPAWVHHLRFEGNHSS